MLAVAEKAAQRIGLDVTLQVMDAEALTFANDRFDTVVSALSTCTFPDPIAALQEMSRVCKAGGRILLLEHGRSSLRPLAQYQDRQAQTHYKKAAGCRWNQEPTALVKAAGLRLISVNRTTFGIFYTIQAAPP
jgi:ubiquinone/menaquinone biosynthesis C-methylase UbiE